MIAKRLLFSLTLLSSVALYSCKKEATPEAETINDDASKIITIASSVSDRVDLTGIGNQLDLVGVNSSSATQVQATTTNSYPYTLVYKGKITPLLGRSGNTLSALEVSAYGNYYAISYMTPGAAYGGGIDVFQIQNGVPVLTSSASTTDADITCITNGGGRLFFGMALKTYESFGYEAPAVVGVIKTNGGGSLMSPAIVPLNGYSVMDLQYSELTAKLYAATSTNGGLSTISVSGTIPKRLTYNPYGDLRSLTFSGNDLIGTNNSSYSTFDNKTSVPLSLASWPIPSNHTIGCLSALSNGNLLFGNNYYLVYVNKTNNALIDQIDLGGWINSITYVADKIYISAGNNFVVAVLENGHIKVISKTNFNTLFGGNFDVLSAKVAGNYVFVACGDRGTYVFNLKKL